MLICQPGQANAISMISAIAVNSFIILSDISDIFGTPWHPRLFLVGCYKPLKFTQDAKNAKFFFPDWGPQIVGEGRRVQKPDFYPAPYPRPDFASEDARQCPAAKHSLTPVRLLLVAGGGIRSRYLLNMNQESRALAHGATAH